MATAAPSRLGRGSGSQNTEEFFPAATYDVGAPWATWLATGDVNGDGKIDLLVTNAEGSVAVLLGNGDGTFLAPHLFATSGFLPRSVVLGDTNRDGNLDLIVANYCGSENCGHHGTISVLLGNGDGTFQTSVSYDAGGWPTRSVAVADVNGDGRLDVVVPINNSSGPGSVGVLLGNGDGTFQAAVTYPVGEWPWWAEIADINHDGIPDLLVANHGDYSHDGSVGLLLGNGNGTFGPMTVVYNASQVWPNSLSAVDLNRDGVLDLCVANQGSIALLLGNPDGTFQPATYYDSGGNSPVAVAASDLNADDLIDIVLAAPGTVGVLMGNGDGALQPPAFFNTGGSSGLSTAVAVVDLNGDRKPDILALNECGDSKTCGVQNGTVGVLLSNGAAAAPTTTILASSLSPSSYGQTATFTATVTAGSGTPTGTVNFYDGTVQIGTGTLANGSTSLSTASLVAGTHSITAAYQGSGNFEPSTSSPVSQVVNLATTKTSLSSSAPRTRINRTITYTAIVTGQYGGSATGNVEFKDNGAVIANVALAGNQARYTLSYNRRGIHSIVATYSGDANNLGSISPSLVQLISHLRLEMRPHLTSSQSPSMVGQAVSFTLTVGSPWGLPPDGDWVYFFRNRSYLGAVQMVGGAAVFTTSDLSAGSHAMRAIFAGDSVFRNGDDWFRQFVNRYTTTATLTSTPNPSHVGDTVTFTMQVSSSGPTPTGTVKFFQGGTLFASSQLSDGIAQASTASLRTGTHAISARYVGDAYNGKSTSPVVYQVVQ